MRHHHHHHRAGWHARMQLHRRLFSWFGASILLTGLLVALFMRLADSTGSSVWKKEIRGAAAFLGQRFGAVWADPLQRRALAESIAQDFNVDLRLADAKGATLDAAGPQPCLDPLIIAPITRGGAPVGSVQVCCDRLRPRGWHVFLPLLLGAFVLWIASGRIARRLLRPLREVIRVAEEIGQGKLSSRTELCFTHGEERVLADSIDRMAGRIERQMADQRELLAAVSHELRTPLGHIRILLELGRQNGIDLGTLDEVEKEVTEIDSLVGELLASSRLDFGALTLLPLDGGAIARRALERAGASPDLLRVEGSDLGFQGDATLLARAVANLLDNAQRHGGGATALWVESVGGKIRFAVEDAGPGLTPGEEQRAFEAFYHRPKGNQREASGLGLGLALVQRIAQAHRGSAFASNRPQGGARVGFELPQASGAALADSRPEPKPLETAASPRTS